MRSASLSTHDVLYEGVPELTRIAWTCPCCTGGWLYDPAAALRMQATGFGQLRPDLGTPIHITRAKIRPSPMSCQTSESRNRDEGAAPRARVFAAESLSSFWGSSDGNRARA